MEILNEYHCYKHNVWVIECQDEDTGDLIEIVGKTQSNADDLYNKLNEGKMVCINDFTIMMRENSVTTVEQETQ